MVTIRVHREFSLEEHLIPRFFMSILSLPQDRVLAIVVRRVPELTGIDSCLRAGTGRTFDSALSVSTVHVAELVALARVGAVAGGVAVDDLAPKGSDDGDGSAEGGDEVFGSRVDEHIDCVDWLQGLAVQVLRF